ncbi:MAG: nucleotidyl transferase AbiEii/AbiGii toxin family protein [Pseudomonadota bacterium]
MADYTAFLSASADERRGAFLATAARLNTAEINVEKDFWVCWTLDALFNRLTGERPRLLFKGGTSLSKDYNLISRFSEDVDVTVFRDDLGQAVSALDLEGLSNTKRKAKLDEIKVACQAYVAGPLLEQLANVLAESLAAAGLEASSAHIEPDPDDRDGQTLLLWYPTVSGPAGGDAYVRPAVKIESGAKSALDPNPPLTIGPYVHDDLPGIDLRVHGVVTVDPERTFWDKVVIAHGLRRWFGARGVIRGGGQRVTRHYYDLHQLMESEIGERALGDLVLGADCVGHARMFFNSPDLDLGSATPGTFALKPTADMLKPLEADYRAMSGMIFRQAPAFETVMDSMARLDTRLNAAPRGQTAEGSAAED